MDVGNGVLQFERTILSAAVKSVNPENVTSTDPYDLFIFEIKGLAFLYHQVSNDINSGLFLQSSKIIRIKKRTIKMTTLVRV